MAVLPATIPAGAATDVQPGTLRAVSGAPAAIGRDTGGIYALSLVCTHEQCDIGRTGFVSAAGLECGCHGSQFDANGNVTRGPAASPLPHLLVTADMSGQLTIHGDQPVPPGMRI